MSLFKAYKRTPTALPLELIKEDFLSIFDEVCSNEDKITKEQVAGLITVYTEYSVGYLQTVAITLEEPFGSAQTMKFMNSIIAEAVHERDLHYFDKDQGYSIIDKTVQQALDSGKPVSLNSVLDIIDLVEATHVEEEEEFEEEFDHTLEESSSIN